MKKVLNLLSIGLLVLNQAYAQSSVTGRIVNQCGDYAKQKLQPYQLITAKGYQLAQFYDQLNVENLWISGNHIDWESGRNDYSEATIETHTHCSAFVASACKRLGLYILRPPEHRQMLLANAQFDWLASSEAKNLGLGPISEENKYVNAQSFANEGMVVLATCKNPDPQKPGHIAIVRPANFTMHHLQEWAPEIIMAGTHNHQKISLKTGFKSHVLNWPEDQILFYYNTRFISL